MNKKQEYQPLPSTFDDVGPHRAENADEPDHHRNAPRPSGDCLYGLIGEIAAAGSENTEANPFAIAASAIAYLGVAVGRGPYMPIGDDWNHARVFFTHVGRSSRGRKGTSKKLVISRIARAVSELQEDLAPQIHTGGLSTREGLALMIHDGWTHGKEEVPPVHDKRLLVVESEFANVLHQAKRDGNTLSAALRDAWDGTSIRPATKSTRVWATNPHIGMISDVTPSELRDLMASRELSNGFANRFIFFWAEGDKVNPFPKSTPREVVNDLAEKVATVLRFAGADRYVDRDTHRMELSPEAAKTYANLYRGELRSRNAGEMVSGLLDRRAPVLLRLAMIFALTDLTWTIDTRHIKAAMAWIRYWMDSVKFIFQSGFDEIAAAELSETSERIVRFLEEHDKATRTELTKTCFAGHIRKDQLDRAIDELLTANPPVIEVETVPRPAGEPGSATKFYRLCAKSANSAKAEQFHELSSHPAIREFGETCEFSGSTQPSTVRTFSTVRTTENTPLTRADIDTSQISQSSQGNRGIQLSNDTEVL